MQDLYQEEEIDLFEYWNVLCRRKKMLIIMFAVFVTLAMVISLLSPKYYKSQAVILVSGSATGGLGAALSSSPLGGVLGGVGLLHSQADTALAFLQSRTIAEKTINKFGLMKILFRKQWDDAAGTWKDPEKRPFMEDAVKLLTKKIVSQVKNKDDTITISVVWKDPQLAADMANYYVTALADILNERSMNLTIQVIDMAVPAHKKYKPKTALNMVLAGMLSLFLGVFIAFFREYLEKHKKTEAASKA
jgi:uncharacterized protein involved in exopolysaccharide biosynthesis